MNRQNEISAKRIQVFLSEVVLEIRRAVISSLKRYLPALSSPQAAAPASSDFEALVQSGTEPSKAEMNTNPS